MKKQNNLYKKIGIILSFFTVLLSTGYTIIAYLKESSINPIYFGLLVLIILLFMTLIKNGYSIEKIFKFMIFFNKNPMKGFWNIEIQYVDECGEICVRTGNCEFVDTVFGISIKGGNIYDKKTQKLEIDYWLADNVDIFSRNNGEKEINCLIYHYNIYMDKSNNVPLKSGFVIAEEKNGVYQGKFKDFIVAEGRIEREGEVTLFIAK